MHTRAQSTKSGGPHFMAFFSSAVLCCVSFKTQSNGRAGHRWGYLWRYRAVSIWRSHRSLLSALLLAAIKCSRVPSNLLHAGFPLYPRSLSLSHTHTPSHDMLSTSTLSLCAIPPAWTFSWQRPIFSCAFHASSG